MSTQITLPSTGGASFDGTDYIYVYGNGTPLENGVELQDALYQAGIDKVATGRRQTVVVGPGDYQNTLGTQFNIDLVATSIKSLTGDRDVNLSFAANTKVVAAQSTASGIFANSFIYSLNNSIYNAQKDLEDNYGGSSSFMQTAYCNSNYIALEDNSLILYNQGTPATSGGTGQRIIKVSENNHTIGPDLNLNFFGFNIDKYWVVKNPISNLREVYVHGYWPAVNNFIFFKINLTTLNADSSFSSVITDGAIEDIVLDSSGNIIIGGYFSQVNYYTTVNIAKIQPNGQLEIMSFTNNTGVGFNSTVRTLAYDSANNRLYCGGDFDQYNGNLCPNFTILNATNAAFIASSSYPNSPISALKFWPGDTNLYAFGGFTFWGSTATTGKNVILNLAGGYTGELFSTNVSNFYSKIDISANIEDSVNKIIRFNNSAGAPLIQSTLINPNDLIEYNITSGSITPYNSNSIGSPSFAYTINSANNTIGQPSFLVYGSLNFENLALLNSAGTVGYSSSQLDDIQGLNIKGAFITKDSFSNIKINNCLINNIFNISSYLNFPSFISGNLLLKNSTITKIICPVHLELFNSNVYTVEANLNGMEAYVNISATDSLLQNVYNNGPAIYLNSVTIKNSTIENSFNDGYKGTASNFYLKTNNFTADESVINNSFNFSKLPRLYLFNCELQSSFNFPYLPGGISGEKVLNSNISFAGSLINIKGSGYLNQDYSFSYGYNLSNYYFYQSFDMIFINCTSEQGQSLNFNYIPVRGIFRGIFRDCSILGFIYYGDSQAALNIHFRPGYNQNLNNAINNIVFENCRVDKASNAFNVILLLEDSIAAGTNVEVNNITVNNCHHTAQTTIMSSMCFGVSTSLAMNMFTLRNIDIRNSSVKCPFVNSAFVSTITNVTTLTLDKINFTNCHVLTANTSSYSFLSYIVVNQLLLIAQTVTFKDCSAATTEGNTNYYPTYPLNYKQIAHTNAFFANVYANFIDNSVANTPLIFINCEADRGFVDNSVQIPGVLVIYAENCVANAGNSFGKGMVTLKGSIIRCDGGVGSFGDAWFKSSWGANHTQTQFVYCMGINSFGTDKTSGSPISSGGKLYHYTTTGGTSNWSTVTWAGQNYNV